MKVFAGLSLAFALALCCHLQAAAPRPVNKTVIGVAPQDCLVFVHNFGFDASAPDSQNSTERLFAEPSVQEFIGEIRKLANQGLAKLKESNDDDAPQGMQQILDILQLLADRPFSFYVTNVSLDEYGEPETAEVGFIVDAGEKIDQLRGQVDALKAQAPAEKISSETIAGVRCVRLEMDQQIPMYWGTKGNYFMASIGDGSLERLIGNIKAPTPDWLQQHVKRLPVPRRWLLAYVDGGQLSKLASGEEAQKTWAALGLDKLKSISAVVGLDDDGILMRALVATSAQEGLVEFCSAAGLTTEDMIRIPKDVVSCAIWKLDPTAAFDTFIKIVSRANPRNAERMQQQLAKASQSIGADIRQDIVAGFGDRLVTYSYGQIAGMAAPDFIVAVDVRDAASVQKVLDILEQAINGQRGRVRVGNTKFGDRPAYYLGGAPISPSWCLTEDHLVVGTRADTVAAFLDGKLSKSESVASHPDVARVFDEFENPFSVTYFDSKKSMQGLYASLPFLLNMAAVQLRQQGIEFDATKLPPLQDVAQHLKPSASAIRRTDDGIELVSRQTMPNIGAGGASAPILVALLLPAVNAARAAARRAQSINNLRQIGLASVNYESATGRYPTAKHGEGNDRGLSWRVAILPYLEEQALYDRFHHDEPWDSEHNKQLIKEIPKVYWSPASYAERGMTNYLAVRGEDSIIADAEEGTRIREIRDGTSKTALVVEVDDERAVPWTKPDDYEWDPDAPTAGLGNLHPGEIFLVVFADVSVRAMTQTVDDEILKAIYTKNGGEVVDVP